MKINKEIFLIPILPIIFFLVSKNICERIVTNMQYDDRKEICESFPISSIDRDFCKLMTVDNLAKYTNQQIIEKRK